MAFVTRSAAIPARLERGRVLAVDPAACTVDVATQFTREPQSGIPWSSPYGHHRNGEGIHFCPEPGAICWLAFPSDGNRPFVVAFGDLPSKGRTRASYRGRKPALQPGDIYLGTRDGNRIHLRRGGVVQVIGGPLSQRLYIPAENLIRDMCGSYSLRTLGGDLEWSVRRPESNPDGKAPAALVVSAREFAPDPSPSAVLSVGSHADAPGVILRLVVRASGSAGAETTSTMTVDREGNVKWAMRRSFVVDSEGSLSFTAREDASLSSREGEASVSGATARIAGTSGVEVDSPNGEMVVSALAARLPRTFVGGGSVPVILATPALITWLLGHTHVSSAPGTPTTPPVPGAPPFPADHVSTNLFSK